jgi:hypothetical protein
MPTRQGPDVHTPRFAFCLPKVTQRAAIVGISMNARQTALEQGRLDPDRLFA